MSYEIMLETLEDVLGKSAVLTNRFREFERYGSEIQTSIFNTFVHMAISDCLAEIDILNGKVERLKVIADDNKRTN